MHVKFLGHLSLCFKPLKNSIYEVFLQYDLRAMPALPSMMFCQKLPGVSFLMVDLTCRFLVIDGLTAVCVKANCLLNRRTEYLNHITRT